MELIGEEKKNKNNNKKHIKASIDSIVIKVSMLTFFKKKKKGIFCHSHFVSLELCW